MTALVWFRNDLRLHDNPALIYALKHHDKVLCLYIHDEASPHPLGGASRWWLNSSLDALNKSLISKGGGLILRSGDPVLVIPSFAQELGVRAVYWNRRYDVHSLSQDNDVEDSLSKSGWIVKTFNSYLLFEPWEILTLQKEPFQVFGSFWKKCLSSLKTQSMERLPDDITGLKTQAPTHSLSLDTLSLVARGSSWISSLDEEWIPGEVGAQMRVQRFFDKGLRDYKENRNSPAKEGTSKLSPHLHFGEVSPRQLWHRAHQALAMEPEMTNGATAFLSELGWREFSYHMLYHAPEMTRRPLRKEFEKFRWETNPYHLRMWQKGLTGYPIVDAGMRELWQTGWMHNRARMIVASFLIKDLLIDWREGAAWFWDALVDADLANNFTSWQWVAGSGIDSAPYFRIFNPTLQGQKFDPQGEYIRRFIPEIANLPNTYIHTPWEAPTLELRTAGVALGKDYPYPIVDHKYQRAEALKRFKELREGAE